MSHNTGTVLTLGSAIRVGPDSGAAESAPNTWSHDFAHLPAPGGTKFLILHFQNVALPASNRLEVDLGYGTDVFTAADGDQFWTRPVNLYVLPGGLVPIRYITDGAASGVAELDRYGRGERLPGDPGHGSISNSDPFFGTSPYDEPVYDPFWFCAPPPDWENVAAVGARDVRRQVAPRVGMIVTVHAEGGVEEVSSCTVTLVDTDKVITAGHCLNTDDWTRSSVTFDYRTEADGARPAGYNAVFHKVAEELNRRWDGTHDYALLRLATVPGGVAPAQLRHDLPLVGESVFGIHQPNGAPKKLSPPHPAYTTVTGTGALSINVPSEFHITGGSSGSGLFDAAGRIAGVLSRGHPCAGSPLIFYPISAYLDDTVPAPPPPVTRDVMVVIDRSGSMSEPDGSGRSKIEAARDAVSLFVQLVRAGTGNRVGLASFSSSASAPVDFALANLTDAAKETLIGTAPFSGGVVGALTPGGATSIGDGLDAARAELTPAGANPRAILLLTDGMENTDPTIASIEDGLGAIEVNALGFGTEANLDGDKLGLLAGDHDGLYMRAEDGLALEKFFTEAFGNIFEAGLLFDPELRLPAGEDGEWIRFPVCGEEALTLVAGWDETTTRLRLEVETPAAASVTASTAGVEAATGLTWTFLRLTLPHAGERNGEWRVRVRRPTGSVEFPPPTPALRYFVNIVPSGGPRLLRVGDVARTHYYTGDAFNPLVMLRYADGGWPTGVAVEVTLERPNASVGTRLAEAGLRPGGSVGGDGIPPLQASIRAIEGETGTPIVGRVQQSVSLGHHAADTGGYFEGGGIYGRPLADALVVEGDYRVHARARYGGACTGARELVWSAQVAVGIDPDATGVSSVPTGTSGDGDACYDLTMTPRDRYGNHLGPGRADRFTLHPVAGTRITSPVVDLGNGSYRVGLCWDPMSADPPGLGIEQPGRDRVILTPRDLPRYVYSVKFLCGEQRDGCDSCAPVVPGRYATEINIHNHGERDLVVVKRVVPLVLAGAARGRAPQHALAGSAQRLVLGPHEATMEDCCSLQEMALGAPPPTAGAISIGILEIVSTRELTVTAVYTAAALETDRLAIDVHQVQPVRVLPDEPQGAPSDDRPAHDHLDLHRHPGGDDHHG